MAMNMISRFAVRSFIKINLWLNGLFFKGSESDYSFYRFWIENFSQLSEGVVLDLGSGVESVLLDYIPHISNSKIRFVAIDQSLESLSKNCSFYKVVAKAESLPFCDGSIDLIASSCFFEHVEVPQVVIKECHRILKQGGALVFLTPNRWFYSSVLARITPFWFHHWVRKLQLYGQELPIETSKTYYKMNTLADLTDLQGNFERKFLQVYTDGPCYTLFFPPPLHLFFVFIHLIFRHLPWLGKIFGARIVGCWVKPKGNFVASKRSSQTVLAEL